MTDLFNIVDETVASGLRTDEATTPVVALTSQDADELVAKLLVSTEQETDLTTTSSNVTS